MSSITRLGGMGSGIALVRDAFDDGVIDRVLLLAEDAMEDGLGGPGKTMGGHMPETKNTHDISLSRYPEWTGDWSPEKLLEVGYDVAALDRGIAEGVTRSLHLYDKEYRAELGASVDTGYQIQRYRVGEGMYLPHVDGTITRSPERQLALVIYLNDVHKGGETDFPWHGVAVRPRAGHVVVFPTTFLHLHEAKVPISNDKYMISTFIIHDQGE